MEGKLPALENLPHISLASFYTPSRVTQILANWAILDPRTTVLDPGFGGCAFLLAAMERLRQLGNKEPGKQIYGVDSNPNALSSIQPLLAAGALPKQFIISDFFDVHPQDLECGSPEVILGNPPHVQCRDIPGTWEKAIVRLGECGIRISERTSYGTLFLLYAVQLLRSGGRLAMILPGAFLHTDYSLQFHEVLTQRTQDLTILLLQERVSNETEGESALVLASGARASYHTLRISSVATIKDLGNAIRSIQSITQPRAGKSSIDTEHRALTHPPLSSYMARLRRSFTHSQWGFSAVA